MMRLSARKLIFITLLLLLPIAAFGASAAANTVPRSMVDEVTNPISITDLVPPECQSLGINRIETADGQVRGSGKNTLYLGTSGNDTLRGGNGSDCLLGGDGDDVLYGGQGNDVLLGGSGNDRLFGDQGTDVCYGGGGGDSFDRCETIK